MYTTASVCLCACIIPIIPTVMDIWAHIVHYLALSRDIRTTGAHLMGRSDGRVLSHNPETSQCSEYMELKWISKPLDIKELRNHSWWKQGSLMTVGFMFVELWGILVCMCVGGGGFGDRGGWVNECYAISINMTPSMFLGLFLWWFSLFIIHFFVNFLFSCSIGDRSNSGMVPYYELLGR